MSIKLSKFHSLILVLTKVESMWFTQKMAPRTDLVAKKIMVRTRW